jgi:hypothetical protein
MMRITLRTLHVAVAAAALALAAASPAFATPQTAQAETTSSQRSRPVPPASQGPLVLTPIESTFVVAPIAKVTRIAGVNSVLAGFYAGKVLEDRLLVGGSAVWLAGPRDSTRMWYAGAVVGWKVYASGPISVRAQTLVGAGQASQVVSYATLLSPPGPFMRGFPDYARVRVHDGFVLVEPELTLQMKVLDRVRLNLGAGYRGTTRAFGFSNDLRGATGTIGLEVRVGK